MLKSRDQTSIQTKISVSLSVVVVRVRSQPRSEDQTFRLGLKANSSVSISICRPKFPSRSVSRPEYLSWFRWRSDRFGFRSQEFRFGPRHSVSKLRSRFGTSAAERWRCRGRASADCDHEVAAGSSRSVGGDVVLEADDLERRGTQQTVVAERRDAVTIGVDDDGGRRQRRGEPVDAGVVAVDDAVVVVAD